MQIISINQLRRSLTRRITRHLGVTRLPSGSADVGIKTILVCRPNHRLGNLLMITPLLQEIRKTFPEAKVDLFVKGSVAPVLFKNYDNVKRIILLPKKPQKDLIKYIKGWMTIRKNRYDLVINAINSSSSGKMSTHFANGKFKFLGEVNDEIRTRHPDFRHMAKIPVYSFRWFARKLGFPSGDTPIPPLDLKLSETEIAGGKRLLRELLKNEKPAIGIYTYATGKKCYPPAWWDQLYPLLKERFPEYNILEVLPIENVSQIGFKAPSFYSKDPRQIASLISNLTVFIAGDSGMMHLASASGAPVIGLFKFGNIDQYAPYNDQSVGVHTERVSQDEIVSIVEKMVIPAVRKTGNDR